MATPLPRDEHGRILDASGRIIGDLRRWDREPRIIREAAMGMCLDALAGLCALPYEIGGSAWVTLGYVAQASEADLVWRAAEEAAAMGLDGMAIYLRALAPHRPVAAVAKAA